jgi:hypothetical protein
MAVSTTKWACHVCGTIVFLLKVHEDTYLLPEHYAHPNMGNGRPPGLDPCKGSGDSVTLTTVRSGDEVTPTAVEVFPMAPAKELVAQMVQAMDCEHGPGDMPIACEQCAVEIVKQALDSEVHYAAEMLEQMATGHKATVEDLLHGRSVPTKAIAVHAYHLAAAAKELQKAAKRLRALEHRACPNCKLERGHAGGCNKDADGARP